MTRHNLDVHISWLLSHQVTPPVGGVSVAVRTNSTPAADITEAEADFLEEEIEDIPRVSTPVANCQVTQSVNVVQSFVRPPLPSSIAPQPQLRDLINAQAYESMGKLASAQTSTRPGLLSQHQLATPASTTASNSNSKSKPSLTQSFTDSFRDKTGKSKQAFVATSILQAPLETPLTKYAAGLDTPSARPTAARSLAKPLRPFQTPQTPRQTPLPFKGLNTGTIKSIDLTGDSSSDVPTSRSSSTEGFGESVTLWREDAAWRPEPLVRISKKRKSNEISAGSPHKGPDVERKTGLVERDPMDSNDGFMDIDSSDDGALNTQRPRSMLQEPRARSVQPSVEHQDTDNSVEEFQITETISRVETRTRKGISRVPSVSDVGPISSTYPAPIPLKRAESRPRTVTTPKLRSTVQVAASPIKKFESPTPQKPQKRRLERTIRDSDDDDDEILSDVEKRASCSPRTSMKNSPRIANTPRMSRLREIPEFKRSSPVGNDYRSSKPTIGSPLRPISRNVATRQENAASPFHQDSPTKEASVHNPLLQHSSQHTPSSTLTSEDRRLVNLYLTKPKTIATYFTRVMNVLQQNSNTSMEYVDEGKTAPKQLIEERKALLNKKKAYLSLEDIAERHDTLVAEKKDITRTLYELLDSGVDTTLQDEQNATLTQDIRKLEKEAGLLLHISGAIKDGFGTGLDVDTEPVRPAASLQPDEAASSIIGSAQIVLQTQIPPWQQKATSSSNQHMAQTSSRGEFNQNSTSMSRHASPSPVRRADLSRTFAEQQPNLGPPAESAPIDRVFRQPNFYRDPSPMDDGLDDDDFDALLEDEAQQQHQSSKFKEQVAGDADDDYGDGNDDDILEFAQEVERQSLAIPPVGRTAQKPAISQPSKRPISTKKTMYSIMDPAQSALFRYPWSADVKRALKERFNLRGFRQNQLEAINATLGGKDAFILMPTGGGKSLCYQLPAVISSGKNRGVTIVISPLLSLMSDQVDHLKKLQIQALLINGEKTQQEKNLIYDALRNPFPDQYVQLLYVTPEMIGKSGALMSALTGLHRQNKLARIVIDEAHCVSQWGHDFRQDYKTIGTIRSKFPGVPFIALTATATENVKTDCIHNLGMEGCEEYKQSFNRPNLYYEIRSKKGKGANAEILESMTSLILNDYKGQTGIIYTLSRKGCEELAEKLRSKRIKAHHFHASMDPEEKSAVQRDWQAGKWQVVVATIAFGMGIDKPNVRFVIHHTIPKSLEGYYQETGRAGRDGKDSGCYLYYGYQDTRILKQFIEDGEGTEEVKERQRDMLKRMIQFCENRHDCRRVNILSYFGEAFAKEDCKHKCDSCNSNAVFESRDMTSQARAAVNIVKQIQSGNFTLLHAVDILRGQSNAKMKNKDHQSLTEYGAAKDLPRGEAERIFSRLIMENALKENVITRRGFPQQYIHLGPNYRDFLSGRRKVTLMLKVSASPTAPERNASKQVRKAGGPSIPRGSTTQPQSTMLSSPVAPPLRRNNTKGKDRMAEVSDDDDFFASDESDAFEPVRHALPLGPPITTDERLKDLPDLHRVSVQQFLEDAKTSEERLRNGNGHSRPYFTDNDFREMAINWTLTTDDMLQIPGINEDKVQRYGKKFLPLIKRYHLNYEEMMALNDDRDIDQNHMNVIDLCSDGAEDEYDEEDDDHLSQAEQPSKYFANAQVREFNAQIAQAAQQPQRKHPKPDAPRKPRGGSRGGKGKGSKRGARKSNDSASGSGSGFRGGRSNSGVSKRSGSRKASGGAKNPNFMKLFGGSNNGGGAGGGAGGMGEGRIGPMPT
ncbi:ATP-dependent DNA helicase [Lachnellula occidentalis]|uniref:DNA 3'-5' helicase n=1 Tax=Lachnellula occidentalis TaxID=215460 RepID=A0A8H8SB39_9HELO|nr:ATP-dependent DNA helicase [Lachnellula occidentalis]